VYACHFCSGAITTSYYRVGPVMACEGCVEKERANELANRGKFFRRGLLFAIPAAFAGSLMMWGIDELSMMSGSSLMSPGAFLRGAATLFLGFMVGEAGRSGAKKRGSRALQVSVAILTYLAYSMAIVPYVLSRTPSAKITLLSVAWLFLLAPAYPFLALMKSLLAITGLVVLFLAICKAWAATAPAIPVSGPFDVTDKYAEKPLFKGLGA
jgi:hypothetical protein